MERVESLVEISRFSTKGMALIERDRQRDYGDRKNRVC